MREGLAGEKRAARALMRGRLAEFGAEARAAASASIGALIAGRGEWRDAAVVLAYLSSDEEPDTAPLVERALSEGKEVYAPRVNGDALEFKRVVDPAGPWDRGSFGIREPAAAAAPFEPARARGSILVIVPGLAFDRSGRRLGRGKGYYDRFIASIPPADRPRWFLAAAAFGFQLLERAPAGDADERVDAVACESGWIDAIRIRGRAPR